MGEDVLREAGIDDFRIVCRPVDRPSADDTVKAAQAFKRADVDIIVFCGGDGTARDIVRVVGTEIAVLGIPSGVKMYSGVFGMTPLRTVDILAGFVDGKFSCQAAEIVDLDEDRYREGEWVVKLYHAARTPYEPALLPVSKMIVDEIEDAEIKRDIAEQICEEMQDSKDTLFLLGPGSTVESIAAHLGIEKTLLGIDAVANQRPVGRDLNESGIQVLVKRYPRCKLVVSPIGAQGFILGRGNLQLSPQLIRRIGKENIIVIATPSKLLRTPVLRFDTGDDALDADLASSGYWSVRIGRDRHRVVRIER
jgi:predicted polyphosphate/ATP-dependent NAD kinase